MDLSNSGAIPPLNPFAGPQILPKVPEFQSPQFPALPVVVRDPTTGMMGGKLPKHLIIILLPQQLLQERGADTLLNPVRIFAMLTKGAQPQGENPPAKSPKAETAQRDEAAQKGDSGKGPDLVNIQVFKGEKGSGDLRNNKSGESVKAQTSTSTSENSKSEGKLETPKDGFNSAFKESIQEKKSEPTLLNKSEDFNSEKENAPSEKVQVKESLSQPDGKDKNTPIEKKSFDKASSPSLNQPKSNDVNTAKSTDQNIAESKKETINPNQAQGIEKSDKPNDAKLTEQPVIADKQIPERQAAERPKEGPEKNIEKAKDQERVSEVQRENKFQNIEHAAGHRILAHGKVEHRTDAPAAYAAGASIGSISSETDMIIPLWLVVFFQNQQDEEKLKGKGRGGAKGKGSDVFEHRFSDVLFMLLCASVAGCRNVGEYISFIGMREKWFKVVLGEACHLPSKELLWRILSSFDSEAFQNILKPLLLEVCGGPSKYKNEQGKPILPAISLWHSPLGIIFGQTKGSDPSLDVLAMPLLLQVMNLEGGFVVGKASNEHFLGRDIEDAGANYILEVLSGSELEDQIDLEMESAAKTKDSAFNAMESYIEGQDRIVIETLDMDKSSMNFSKGQFLKIYTESFSSKGGQFSIKYFVSNFTGSEEGIFDLIRIQKPIDRKVAWYLNFQMPLKPMQIAFQQCMTNLELLHGFAVSLLKGSGSKLTLTEQMELAASNNDELLKIFR